jgi:hypothetical protein
MQLSVTKVPKALWGTAHHEAGHAVVHLHFGLPFDCVTIVPDEDGSSGHMLHPSPSQINVDERCMKRERRKMARQMILGCYAGLYAQRLTLKGVPDWDGACDFADALRLSMTYGVFPRYMDSIGDELHERYLRRLRRESKRLVRKLSLPIQFFAQHLLERKTMTGDEAEAVMRPLLSEQWPPSDPIGTGRYEKIRESRPEDGYLQHMFIADLEM